MRCEYCDRVIKPDEYSCPGCGAPIENPEPLSQTDFQNSNGTKINVSVGGVNISIDGATPKGEKQASFINQPPPVDTAQSREQTSTQANLNQQESSRYHMKYSGFFARVCATWLDWVICGMITLGLLLTSNEGDFEIFLGVWCLYDIICLTYFDGGTPGKKGMRMKVVNKSYEKITLKQAIIRTLSKMILWPICIGYLMVLFSNKKRSLHDCMAGTYVIKD